MALSFSAKADMWINRVKRHRGAVIIGAIVGLMFGGLSGIFFGGAVGFFLSYMLVSKVAKYAPNEVFFRATFTVMGKLAKADGRVSQDEITFARGVMNHLQLSEQKRREAIELFTQGKSPDFDMASVLTPLASFFRTRPALKLMFVEIQLQAALADGDISQAEMKIIQEICTLLRMNEQEVAAVVSRMQAQQSFYSGAGMASNAIPLSAAYQVLGVPEQATDAEVKRAYRKLMSQHHPDKLVAKGLPEEMVNLAKEKTQEIQNAYEQIKSARGK
ncbi:MAG: co-chaperone DjlA [Pontibacterium sp.]